METDIDDILFQPTIDNDGRIESMLICFRAPTKATRICRLQHRILKDRMRIFADDMGEPIAIDFSYHVAWEPKDDSTRSVSRDEANQRLRDLLNFARKKVSQDLVEEGAEILRQMTESLSDECLSRWVEVSKSMMPDLEHQES